MFSIGNREPVVKYVQSSGKEVVSLYDYDTKKRKNVLTTKENADKFINNRNEKLDKARQKASVIAIAALAAGLFASRAIFGKTAKSIDVKKILNSNDDLEEAVAKEVERCLTGSDVIMGTSGALIGYTKGYYSYIKPEDTNLSRQFIAENTGVKK